MDITQHRLNGGTIVGNILQRIEEPTIQVIGNIYVTMVLLKKYKPGMGTTNSLKGISCEFLSFLVNIKYFYPSRGLVSTYLLALKKSS